MSNCLARLPKFWWRVFLLSIPISVFIITISIDIILSPHKAIICLGVIAVACSLILSTLLIPLHPDEQNWEHSTWAFYKQPNHTFQSNRSEYVTITASRV